MFWKWAGSYEETERFPTLESYLEERLNEFIAECPVMIRIGECEKEMESIVQWPQCNESSLKRLANLLASARPFEKLFSNCKCRQGLWLQHDFLRRQK